VFKIPIIGFSIENISAGRKNPPRGRIDITSSPKIVSVVEKKLNIVKDKKAVAVGFEFTTEYKPDVANISMKGELLYVGNAEEIVKSWEKEKKLPQHVDIEIKNFLFRKCLSIGLDISENMQLPPPIMFPVVRPKTRHEEKIDEEKIRYIG